MFCALGNGLECYKIKFLYIMLKHPKWSFSDYIWIIVIQKDKNLQHASNIFNLSPLCFIKYNLSCFYLGAMVLGWNAKGLIQLFKLLQWSYYSPSQSGHILSFLTFPSLFFIDNYCCAFVLSPQIWLVMLENQIVVYHTLPLQVIIFLLHLWHRHLKV